MEDDDSILIIDEKITSTKMTKEEDDCQVVAIISKSGSHKSAKVNRKKSPLYTRSKVAIVRGNSNGTAAETTELNLLCVSPKKQKVSQKRHRHGRRSLKLNQPSGKKCKIGKTALKRLNNNLARWTPTPPITNNRPVRYFTHRPESPDNKSGSKKTIQFPRAGEDEDEARTGKFRRRPLIPLPTTTTPDESPVPRNPIQPIHQPIQGYGSSSIWLSYNMMPPPTCFQSESSNVAVPSSTSEAEALPTLQVAPSSLLTTKGPTGVSPSSSLGKPRPIIIDGSNVAIGHGLRKVFSCRGLELCVNRVKECLPHSEIICFVPKFRTKKSQSSDTHILEKLEAQGIVKFTPSREVNGRDITSYDDRFILEYACATGGVVITNDNYKDLFQTEPKWRDTITHRLLQFTWVNDLIMFPSDPLGKYGPSLSQFCSFPSEQ